MGELNSDARRPAAHRAARRFVTRFAILCLVAGAVVSVLVAWICAATIDVSAAPPQIAQRMSDDGEVWHVTVRSTRGACSVLSQRFTLGRLAAGRGPTTAGAAPPEEIVPAWTSFTAPRAPYAARDHLFESRVADARGWPLLAMQSRREKAFAPDQKIRFGLRTGERVLPLLPIWTGLLGNTLLYSGCLFAIASPLIIRQARRRWQQRCLRCGYPVGTSPRCTECGRRVG